MSTTASPATAPRTPSSVRRRQSHAEHDRDRYQATPTRSGPDPSSPKRSMSQQQAPTHSRQSSGAQGQLQNVARRDFEQSNVARPTSSSQRSYSRDDPAAATATAIPVRSDSTRQTPVRNGQHIAPQEPQDLPASAPVATNGASSNDPATHCLLYTSPSPRDGLLSRMPSSA